MNLSVDNPLIVQSDRSLILNTVRAVLDASGRAAKDADGRPMTEEHPRYAAARDALSTFAELEKSPDYLHTYRITPVSIWNAAALGLTMEDVEGRLEEFSCVPLPPNVLVDIRTWLERYGLLRIERNGGRFELVSDDENAVAEVMGYGGIGDLVEAADDGRYFLDELNRGFLKQALIKIGFPVDDQGGYIDGDPYPITLRSVTLSGQPFGLRPYQEGAATSFYRAGTVHGGNGVVVLPCGAGKTVVAIGAMNLVGAKTLILATNTVAVRQWRDEILDKTTLTADEVGEYTGEEKTVRPVTITTYQMLTWRRSKTAEFEHFALFERENWGLVIYDEVHLLPAPIFRATASLQARRRLGLTATLVREDGKEGEVFCLIGPKRYDVPWKVLENKGFIATALCTEVRVPLERSLIPGYAVADARRKFRIASENPAKVQVVSDLIDAHPEGRILVIGQYIAQLRQLARHLKAPLITGKTPNPEREELYSAFRRGDVRILIVSKVANFAIDLPDANIAIQVSGTFGSRQEEAQRLGRILRPKSDRSVASFYSIVTQGSRDQEFAQKRQLFLTEQGYFYEIIGSDQIKVSGVAAAVENPICTAAPSPSESQPSVLEGDEQQPMEKQQ
ncbi:MAG: DNA excision repair protein ERCC-3 [Candidatus Paceibacteria bacterium]|jgi:DNA excision repair protein ERCC-3